MFTIAKEASGNQGSFVRLVRLDADDFAVIVRYPSDGRLRYLYIGPDPNKAEEVFTSEIQKPSSEEVFR